MTQYLPIKWLKTSTKRMLLFSGLVAFSYEYYLTATSIFTTWEQQLKLNELLALLLSQGLPIPTEKLELVNSGLCGAHTAAHEALASLERILTNLVQEAKSSSLAQPYICVLEDDLREVQSLLLELEIGTEDAWELKDGLNLLFSEPSTYSVGRSIAISSLHASGSKIISLSRSAKDLAFGAYRIARRLKK